MCKSHLNLNAGSCVYFFHSRFIHVGLFEFLTMNFNLDFFFTSPVEHPSLGCIAYKFHKHIFSFVLIQEGLLKCRPGQSQEQAHGTEAPKGATATPTPIN